MNPVVRGLFFLPQAIWQFLRALRIEIFSEGVAGGKTDAVNAVQEVQAVRWAAELEHLAFPAEYARVLDTGDCATPELLQRPVESSCVGRIGLDLYAPVICSSM